MKTLYLECNMGAAGDMLMAALLELHPDPADFIRRLNGLGIPSDIYKMVPYAATLVVLAFTSKNSQSPRASGVPYDKGSR